MTPDTPPAATLDEILELDLLTLRAHTERAGDHLDPDAHREKLRRSLADGVLCAVRRDGRLAAYALLRPDADDGHGWFVTGLGTHPERRAAPILADLFAQLAALAARHGVETLRSHVYKTNRLSMNFHRKLGFRITRENARAIEFVATIATLAAHPALRRLAGA
jgi:ribosomal protein S18 acetylase RimI-like enzyme